MEADQKQKPLILQKPLLIKNISQLTLPYFDWTNRWLKGPEYAFILKNMNAYCSKYGFLKLQHKTHPISIYENPINGMIYFVKGKGVGSDFGFPRVAKKKSYRWKKMNFTTNLPKQMPQVTYVVASAMKSLLFQDELERHNFRMHAVILHKDRLLQSPNPPEYILCHVRKVDKKVEQETIELKDCFQDSQVDFYKLFVLLQDLCQKNDQK